MTTTDPRCPECKRDLFRIDGVINWFHDHHDGDEFQAICPYCNISIEVYADYIPAWKTMKIKTGEPPS